MPMDFGLPIMPGTVQKDERRTRPSAANLLCFCRISENDELVVGPARVGVGEAGKYLTRTEHSSLVSQPPRYGNSDSVGR